MRTLAALALVLVACGCADSTPRPSVTDAPLTVPSGPDAILLRIPRKGGSVVARAYPRLDSVVWRSPQRAPALSAFLAFGADDGYLSALDTTGSPIRIDLRLGTVVSMRTALTSARSGDGGTVYGLTSKGVLTRFTPSGGNWKIDSPLPSAALLPQADGSLIGAGEIEGNLIVWRVRPPDTDASDTLVVKIADADAGFSDVIAATAGTVGNRIYIGAEDRVLAINSRDFSIALNLDVGDRVRAMAPTPSGDRVFVAPDGASRLRIIDRFQEGFAGSVRLPSPVTGLRMDPLGRVILGKGPADSILVVSVADAQLRGVISGEWRTDLPLVLADGRIAVARGSDVALVHGITLADDEVIANGAGDWWFPIRWNGFRPRSPGLDQPVEFRRSEPPPVVPDSITLAVDSGRLLEDSTPTARKEPAIQRQAEEDSLFTVSFATLLNERQAQETARSIRVDGISPRVVSGEVDGRTVYRVVLGPYRSRADAERVGVASRMNYWIYTGVP